MIERGAVPAKRHRPAFAALLLALVLTVAYAASADIRATRGAAITADEPFYLLTSLSLLDDGDLDLRQQYERRSYEAFFDHPDGLWRQSVPLADGTLLSPHNPGLSVLLLPGFAMGGLLGAQIQLLALTVLAFVLAFVFAARLTGDIRWSWVSTMAVALTSTAFIYSTEAYPEVPAAVALLTALLIVQRRAPLGPWSAALLVASLSAMPWLGVKYAALAVPVGLWALWRADHGARAVLVALGASSAGFYGWWHLHTFGSLTPYSVGAVYAGDSTASIIGQHLAFARRAYRIVGLFVDERFGVARWAPVLLFAVPGLALLWARGGLARLVLALIAAQFAIAVFVAITMMGWWFPGRTLMVVFPLLVPPIALLAMRLPGWARGLFGVAAAYSIAVMAALAGAGHAREVVIAVDPFEMSSAVFRAPSFLFPNYTWWDVETAALTVAWAVAGLVALTMAWRASGGPARRPR